MPRPSRSFDRPPRIPRSARVRGAPFLALIGIAIAGLLGPVPASAQAGEDRSRVEFLDSGRVLPDGLPFSEAVRVGDVLHLSGMIGVRPGTLELVSGGLRAEARQALENIRTILRAHGSSLEHVVKCTVFMEDIGRWESFNEVYAEFFAAPYPARSALGVDGLALDAALEIECLAMTG